MLFVSFCKPSECLNTFRPFYFQAFIFIPIPGERAQKGFADVDPDPATGSAQLHISLQPHAVLLN